MRASVYTTRSSASTKPHRQRARKLTAQRIEEIRQRWLKFHPHGSAFTGEQIVSLAGLKEGMPYRLREWTGASLFADRVRVVCLVNAQSGREMAIECEVLERGTSRLVEEESAATG